ncbi:MAG: nickel pincer cofactor biosynthesis protein LarC [Thomasclavelia sp.]|jgi:uncharacterized protein (TIGR00299 family) protein|nr:nickel pincer cofactor biosynthesis protein LarC [Thomasclavelia sp.]
MKALYFDCQSGISGNMTIGALLEIVEDQEWFINELNKLNIDGYHLHISKEQKNGIFGTYFDVHLDNEEHHHHHEEHHHDEHHHDHHHEHRNLDDINKIIDDSSIDESAKELAKSIFLQVARAESKVHNEPLDKVHFHEVGAIDSIVDIVGTAILIRKINPDVIISSVVNDGYGFIECAHGTITVPVPATSEIFAANNVVSRQINIPTELVTPTGAAIIATLAKEYSMMPSMNVTKIGWGCGSKDLKIPNVLKVSLGQIRDKDDRIIVTETNIDDCSGEVLGYCCEKLMEAGAKDVFFTPIYMKKNRPAYRLTVICKKQEFKAIQSIIFKETTSIGLRYREENRIILKRKPSLLATKYGNVKAKEVTFDGNTKIYPEYESLKEIAIKNNVSLKDLYQEVYKD